MISAMKNEHLAILMCTYNGERFLEKQLDSFLGQTFPKWDLFVFDDGSINSKVLQFEIKDAEVIEVKPYTKLDIWLAEIPIKDEIQKIFLHFCSGDLIRQDVDIRTDVMEAQHKYPNMRIILQYEQMDRQTIENRAAKYGITLDKFKAVKHTEIASDILSPVAAGGHEEPSEEFVKNLEQVNKSLEDNKDKIKIIDYSKYAVGGNDTVVAPKTYDTNINLKELKEEKDNFTNKSNWFKDRRRRKKKDETKKQE